MSQIKKKRLTFYEIYVIIEQMKFPEKLEFYGRDYYENRKSQKLFCRTQN